MLLSSSGRFSGPVRPQGGPPALCAEPEGNGFKVVVPRGPFPCGDLGRSNSAASRSES